MPIASFEGQRPVNDVPGLGDLLQRGDGAHMIVVAGGAAGDAPYQSEVTVVTFCPIIMRVLEAISSVALRCTQMPQCSPLNNKCH